MLVLFADNSSAMYQLTDASSNDWTLVHDTGNGSDGTQLDDYGQPIDISPPPAQDVVTPPGPTTTGDGSTITRIPDYGDKGGGADAADVIGVERWVDGVIYCMVNGCTHIPPSS